MSKTKSQQENRWIIDSLSPRSDLQNNQLSGTIPFDALVKLTALTTLSVVYFLFGAFADLTVAFAVRWATMAISLANCRC